VTNPPRPPPQWRSPQGQSPTGRPPARPIGTFGKIAIAVGVGVLGYYLLDGHAHTCEGCGNSWRHLGAFNFGEVPAHTCKVCGTVQFWKDGFKHVFPDPSQRIPSGVPARSILDRLQEIREFARHALPSTAPTSPPQQPPPGLPR
jgi:hypothetical protein